MPRPVVRDHPWDEPPEALDLDERGVAMTALATIGRDYPTTGLLRSLSEEEQAAYARDGAAIVRGVIPHEWVQHLRGSHRWGAVYNPIGFKDDRAITDTYVDSPFLDIPDFEAAYDDYDWMIAEAEPGDLLLHHPLTVHGSHGNTTSGYRRALTN